MPPHPAAVPAPLLLSPNADMWRGRSACLRTPEAQAYGLSPNGWAISKARPCFGLTQPLGLGHTLGLPPVTIRRGLENNPWISSGRSARSLSARYSWQRSARRTVSPLRPTSAAASHAYDARDLTHGFLVSLRPRDAIARTRPERGRFRAFLLARSSLLANAPLRRR